MTTETITRRTMGPAVVTTAPAGAVVILQLERDDAYVSAQLADGRARLDNYAHDAGEDDYWTQLPSASAALVMGY